MKRLFVGIVAACAAAVSARGELPEGYMQVRCIQATGAQSIRTGYTPQWNDKITAQFEFTTISIKVGGNQAIYCARGVSNQDHMMAFFLVNGTFRFDHGTQASQQVPFQTPSSVGKVYNLVVDGGQAKATVTENGQPFEVQTSGAGNFGAAGSEMMLFRSHSNGIDNGMDNWASIKLYSFKVESADGTVQRNFVPCVRVADGVVGLYDLSGQSQDPFYTDHENAANKFVATGWNIPAPGGVGDVAALERALKMHANGDEIVLAAGTYSLTETLTNRSGVAVTLRGATGDPKDVIIDGGNAMRCFYLTGSKGSDSNKTYPTIEAQRVVLRDLTVKNGYQYDYKDPNGQDTCCGAGVNIFYGMIDNCIFENCHVVAKADGLAARGGAVFAQIALITNCTFRSCSVSSATQQANGGAINSVNGGSNYGFTLADSVFSNCVATAESVSYSCFPNGGAFYNGPGGSVTRVTCIDCVATNTAGWNNYYHGHGGGGSGGSVSDSVFINCLSYGDGGGFDSTAGTIRNCTFIGNRTVGGNDGGKGGAALAKYAYGCFFTNNIANGNGGALSGLSVVSNCVMIGNQSKTGNGGGAVWTASDIRIEDCVFEQNSQLDLSSGQGGYGGGAVFLGQNANFGAWFDRCLFKDNVAKHTMNGSYENGGGAIFASEKCTNLVVRNSLFAGNGGNGVVDFRAWACGGAATLDEGNGARFENCTFVSNVCTAAGNGGDGNSKYGSLFYCRDKSTVTNRIFAVNCVFEGNSGATYGIFNTNYIMPDEGIADRVLHCVSDDAKGFPASAENGSRVVTKVHNRDLRDKGLDRPWMVGATDLGDGTYTTEKAANHGIDIVWGGRTARILGSAVDIGSEEKLAPGLMLMVW